MAGQSITMQELREELRADFRSMKEDVREELRHYATKEDLAQVETRLIKWMVGLMVGSVAVASSTAILVERLVS